jgi:hypothetical protein
MNQKMGLSEKEAIHLAKSLHLEILKHFEGESAVFVSLACVMSAGVLLVDQADNDPDFKLKNTLEKFVGILREPVEAYLESKKGKNDETNYH